jgi:membrane-associated phospholipid phosphatase
MELDLAIFHFINSSLSNEVFDVFMPWWTDVQKTWPFLYVFLPVLLTYFAVKKNWKAIKVMVLTTVVVVFANNLNHLLVKRYFNRERPSQAILRIEKPKSPSFPSGHAVSSFTIAMFLALVYRRYRYFFLSLAALTAFSRVYLGVHYPSDVVAGAIFGSCIAYAFYTLMQKFTPRVLATIALMTLSLNASAEWKDPTEGKPFFPWVWDNQLDPTIDKAVEKDNLIFLGIGAVATETAHLYDDKLHDYNQKHPIVMGQKEAETFGKMGNGLIGVSIALTQVAFDTDNGLRHTRALLLTSVSHVSIASLVRRDRPGNRQDFLPYPSSFPSGHASSAFATAGSLAYSYGWKAGIPAYTAATMIAASRIRENRHWFSDVVGGAVLGSFWARASFNVNPKIEDPKEVYYVPSPIYDGFMITATKSF